MIKNSGETELERLQRVEREYDEYLRSECDIAGASTDTRGHLNPRLCLAIRAAEGQKLQARNEAKQQLSVLCECLRNIRNAQEKILTQSNFTGAALDLDIAAEKLRSLQ